MMIKTKRIAAALIVGAGLLVPAFAEAESLVGNVFASTPPSFCSGEQGCSYIVTLSNPTPYHLNIDNFLIYLGPDVADNKFDLIPPGGDGFASPPLVLTCKNPVQLPSKYVLPPYERGMIKVPVPGPTVPVQGLGSVFAVVTGSLLSESKKPLIKPSLPNGFVAPDSPILCWEARDTVTGDTLAHDCTRFQDAGDNKELIIAPLVAVIDSQVNQDACNYYTYDPVIDCYCGLPIPQDFN